MDHQRRLQVVLGEAERTDGLLRFVLEAEGFDIIGLASDDQELARVLRGARPAVVVLDGGISVAAALEARQRSRGAALVVVWPDGVSSVIAEERVDPYEVIADLGDAVRRAVDHAELGDEARPREDPIRIPDAVDVAPTIVRGELPATQTGRSTPARSRGRRAQVLVAAATWMLILTALTTIAIAVPNALGIFPGRGGARPSAIGSVNRRPSDPRPEEKATVSEPTGDGSATCDTSAGRHGPPGRSNGRAHSDPVGSSGCHPDHGQSAGGNKGKGGGRPDDPGSKTNKKQKPRGDGAGDDRTQQGDGTAVAHGNAGNGGNSGNGGSAGKVKEHPRTGNGGRNENGHAA